MTQAQYKQIIDEMKELGIEPGYFDKLYNRLKETQQLPPGDIVPWKQYTTIVDYLRNKSILGEDNKVSQEGIKIFESRITLEEKLDSDDFPGDDIRRPSGGVMPCRFPSESSGSKGGLMPCRNTY